MPRVDVQIPTSDGVSNGSLHVPDGAGPWPGVVVFPDAFGLRDTMRDMGDHLASLGYVALVPDVFYRAGDWAPFDPATAFTDEKERGRLFGLISGLTNGRVIADADAYADFLLARPEVRGPPSGPPVTAWAAACRWWRRAASGTRSPRPRRSTRRGSPSPTTRTARTWRPTRSAPRSTWPAHPRRRVHRRARRTARQRADLGRRAAHDRVLPRAPRVRRAGQRALRPGAGRAALGGAARFLRRAALIRWARDYAGAGRNVAAKAWK